MKNSYLLILLSALFVGCSAAKIVPFAAENSPKTPDYGLKKNWAVLPGAYPETLTEVVGEQPEKQVDVFFVYPTLFSDKKDPAWNADIEREDIREEVLNLSVTNQASAFAAAGNLYVPSDSTGFCVAKTRKGLSSLCVSPWMETCFSCIDSSKAD